ncbi:sodium:solute symporter family protein [Fusibacter ferrireducens]|uniref:Sodium:solute symporter family protein n=1 Tax=Fusibacter ferrireducens TaxID=2785058 RepID=A0ABR9ZNX3_9FIRM|nr:sodium:solute symporter family protein [Fusibacter ferrireducens]MBF4692168.1 sodium:solute symporter family protein [Fusibacter ferrireducens]
MNNILVYMLSLTLYTLFLLFWGKNGFKKTNTIRDFCVADNSLDIFTSIFTFTATWFSAVSMQSVTGYVYTYGYITILYSVIGWFLGASILIFAANRIRQYDIMTIPEFFKVRYDSNILQIFGGVIIIACYIFYMIIQIVGFGFIVSELLDIHYNVAIFSIYLFIVYTSFGGLFSVSKTDILNFTIVLLGLLVAATMIIKDIGSIQTMHLMAFEISDGSLLNLSSNPLFPPMTVFTLGLAWGLGTAANPQYLTRILSARNKKTAFHMISYSVIVMGVLYLFLMILGIGSRVIALGSDVIIPTNQVLPYIIKYIIDSPAGGLIFISVIASAISTANSQLILIASSFTHDIYSKFKRPHLSNDHFIYVARIIIFISATMSLILSINPPESLLLFGSYIWGIFAVTFLMPLYGGLYWQKATSQGALWSILFGLLTMAIWYPLSQKSNFLYSVHPVFPGFIMAMVSFFVVSLKTQDKNTISKAMNGDAYEA